MHCMADCSISIIIPAYNVEKYIAAALDSIKEQSRLPDELILIDDGSTDKTLEIAQSYRFPFPYKVISIANAGQGNARNIGISLASSEYIYFFDSDDILTKAFIDSVKTQIERDQYPDIVLFSGESFNDSEYQGNRQANYRRGFSGVFSDVEDFLDCAFRHKGISPSPCLYVSKKSLWGAGGLRFDSNFLEDEAIFLPLLFSCRVFSVIDEVFFLRRQREGSTMTMVPGAKHVAGALNCVQVTLALYKSAVLTRKERSFVRKRLDMHCAVYFAFVKASGLRVNCWPIVPAIVASRNPKLVVKAFLYAFLGIKVKAGQ